MAITMTTKIEDIEKEVNAFIEKAHKETIRMFQYLGERCLIEARDRPQSQSWIDHTGNLRSSIGYVVVYNGSIVKRGGFTNNGLSGEGIKQSSIGTDGKAEGKSLAESLASRFTDGYALIVVAGMNYASKVEALDNKCVLASSELLTNREMPKLMEQLKTKLSK